MGKAADQDLVWGAYTRLSRIKSGKRKGQHRDRYGNPDKSVQRQRRLIKAYADEHGLTVPDDLIYEDNGKTAWKQGQRPDWDRMLADGQAGKFGGLLVWKLDRFARNVRDGEDLLDLGVLLDGPDSGRIDLRGAYGKSVFRKQVEAAAHSSNETSEKVRAAFAEMLEDGYRVGGSGRLFGFEILSQVDGDESDDDETDDERYTGPAAVVRDDEAAVIRELARRLLAGETITAMADDLTERGITTTRGGKWESRNLTRTLGNPLYGGKLAYRGEIIGTLANVEPIMDSETFAAVQAKLGARKRGRLVTGRYPLSGVMLCGNPACERKGTLAGCPRSGGQRAYVCARVGKIAGCGQSVLAAPVEDIVRDIVLAKLADAERLEAMRAVDTALDETRAKLRGLLEELDADMAETEAKLSDTPRSMTRRREQISRNLATLSARYAATERELGELGPAAAPAPPLDAVTAGEWDDPELTPAEAKAAIMRRLGVRVVILPPARRQGSSRLGFDTARVSVNPGS